MIKKIGIGIVVFLIFVSGFYFWASAPAHSLDDYQDIIEINYVDIPSPKDTLSIITFNVGYLSGMTNNRAVDRNFKLFEDNLHKSLNVLQALSPDFIAFQEIDFGSDRSYHVNQLNEFQKNMKFPYAAKAVNWDKTYVPFPYWPISQQFGNIYSGQAVLSNYPLIGMDIIPLVKPVNNPFYYNAFYLDRIIQVAKIKVGKKEMVIINLHLEAFHANTRDAQIITVLREVHKYSEKYPVLVVGDFNSTPPEATHPYQDDHVIKTILSDFQLEMAIGMDQNKKNESANFTFPSDSPSGRLDYIFYNPKFVQIIDARVVGESEQVSDHLPVYMKFALR